MGCSRTEVARVFCLGLTIWLAVTTIACKKAMTSPPKEEQLDANTVAVTPALAGNLKFGEPMMTDVTGTLQLAAHVDTDARLIARVGSPVNGRIVKLLVFEGQNVKAGTVLATLHSTDLSDTQLALVKAYSQERLAETSAKRAEQLVAADVIGAAELERRRAEVLQATTEVSSYRTQLEGLGMTNAQIDQLEKTHKLSADYPIVAPKSGTVLKREVTIGQVVQPADPAFTIANLSTVWVVANVPEEDAGHLKEGLQVTVNVPALPDLKLTGHLSYVSPIVDPTTRTVEVRMDVTNTGGLLKPDQLANMTFTGHMEKKLTVPNAAVVREENRDHVFVRSGNNRYTLREVSLGDEENDRRVVLSGVREGEAIVAEGAFHLNNQRKQNGLKGGE